jgi:hypothetical protein
MKLYATTTSERATKGQGGNKYIVITLTDEDGTNWAEITAQAVNIIQENPPLDEILLTVKLNGTERFRRTHYAKQKGNKQKGEKCVECKKYGVVWDDNEDEFVCQDCGEHYKSNYTHPKNCTCADCSSIS